MSVYLDASVLVAAFSVDALTERSSRLLGRLGTSIIVSDFARAEFASALARKLRARELTRPEALSSFDTLDEWIERSTSAVRLMNTDVRTADQLIRRLELPLRTPDAIHLAIVQRLGSGLATFDKAMAASAAALGLTLVASD